ncbi:MAG TPA: hypothetical protein VLY63_21070 [Anaerolineae bacterium]|nr:hypothetical protein [Anaerolineae bacterium]
MTNTKTGQMPGVVPATLEYNRTDRRGMPGLVVPFGQAEERFVAHFDPEMDLIHSMESMC